MYAELVCLTKHKNLSIVFANIILWKQYKMVSKYINKLN